MYFLYADESGDVGIAGSPTQYFCLSGFVVHELRWHETLERVIEFRRALRDKYGFKLRDELHAQVLMQKPGEMARIPKSIRLKILKETLLFQSSLSDINILNVVVDKSKYPPGTDIFKIAWETLIQRFHNTLSHKNFPGPQNPDDRGILFVDQTDEVKLRLLLRRMRRYNPIPSMFGSSYVMSNITTIVEDAIHRNSLHSYFIQLADVNAYFLYQKYKTSKYIARKGGRNYLDKLAPVLCTKASSTNALGIVER
jgi:hypothetical protein